MVIVLTKYVQNQLKRCASRHSSKICALMYGSCVSCMLIRRFLHQPFKRHIEQGRALPSSPVFVLKQVKWYCVRVQGAGTGQP